LVLVLGLVGSGIATKVAIGARNSAHRALSDAVAERRHALEQAAISKFRAAQERAALALQTSPTTAVIEAVEAARIDPQANAPDLISTARSLIGSLSAGLQFVPSFGVSPDSSRVFAVGADGSFSLWDLKTGTRLAHTAPRSEKTLTGAFDRSGALVATGTDHGAIRVWDAETGKVLGNRSVGTDPILDLDFSPQSTRLLLGRGVPNGSSAEEFLDWRSGRASGPALFDGTQFQVEFDTSGAQWLELPFTGGANIAGSIARCRGAEGQSVPLGPGSTGSVLSVYEVRFGPAGNLLAVASSAGVSIDHFGLVESPQPPPGFPQPACPRPMQLDIEVAAFIDTGNEPVVAVSWSSSGSQLVTAGIDGRAVVYDVMDRQVVRTLTFRSGSVLDAVFSGDGQEVALALSDGTWRVWDLAADRQVGVFRDPNGAMPLGVAFLPNSRMVTQDAGGTVFVWDVGKPDTPLTTLNPSN
jgi:WD40 repeat protein